MAILPVTAVCYLNHPSVILFGAGPYLSAFVDNELQNRIELFSKAVSIHAIIARKHNAQTFLSVCGQRELQIIRFTGHQIMEQIYQCPIKFDDWLMSSVLIDGYVCAVTIHNKLIILELSTGTVVRSCEPVATHIVYSAAIHGSSIESLKIASGSVFNKILIWKPNSLKPVELIGHQGVIFSVRFNETGTNLVSVSDDRTVRVWNVDTNTLLSTFYGHTSRVWDAQFIQGTCDSKILSIGEDCTVRIWDVRFPRCVHAFLGHRGKSIWSLAIHPSGDFAVTGGNDCSVRKWDLTPLLKDSFSVTAHTSFDQDFPRLLRNVDRSNCIVLTNTGSLLLFNVDKHSKSLAFRSELVSSYGVMALSPQRDIVALGGLKGDVILLRVSDWKVLHLDTFVNGKVVSLNWSSQYLSVSGQDGGFILARVSNGKVEKLNSFSLPSTNKFVSSFVTVEVENCLRIVCGDSKGSMHLYMGLDTDAISLSSHSLFKIHGANPVTSLQTVGDLIYSTGRDGKLVLLCIQSGKLVLKNSFQIYKNYGWLERIYLSPEGPILAVVFHANEILLVNVREDAILLAVPCGGGHRSWDINNFEEIMTGHFFLSYIKCSEVFTEVRTLEPISIRSFSVPFLGRECISVCFLSEDKNNLILACGSESGEISILRSSGSDKLEVVATNQCHVGNILSLATCCYSNGSKFLFSAGGRGSLKAWEINLGKTRSMFEIYYYSNEISAKPIYKRKSKKEEFEIDDFRITTVSVLGGNIPLVFCGCSDGYIRVYVFDQDEGFRLVSLVEHAKRCVLASCLYLQNNLTPFLLSAATDGAIVIWNLSPLLLYLEQNENISQDISPSNLFEKSSVFIAHQSGVNSIFTLHNPPFNTLKVASAGDDNCVTITTIESNQKVHNVTNQISDSHQHASSIMSTRLLYLDAVIYLVTVGRDQVLKLLRLDETANKLILVSKEELSVTNISGMECKLFGNQLVVFVFGEGIQCISLILEK